MKQTRRMIVLAMVASMVLFSACSNDDEAKKEEAAAFSCPSMSTASGETKNLASGDTLSGAHEGTVVIPADATINLCGKVEFKNGSQLTINNGVTIKGETRVFTYLLISQGGKINATGTSAKPIVFTSANASGSRGPSDWGGVVIHGKAPVNNTAGYNTASDSEIYTGPYGGDVAADNSGTLQYVRIEFAGKEIAAGKEFNGLFLAGVGSGTTIDYLQTHRGSDDGIEIFGGSVDMKHIVITNNQDDGFDLDEGWKGTGSYIAVAVPKDGDQGIEYDGLGADANRATNTILSNFTIIGADTKTKEGIISVRKKGGIRLYNSYIANAWGDLGTIAVNKSGADASMQYKFSSNVVESMWNEVGKANAKTDDSTLFCGADDPGTCGKTVDGVVQPGTKAPSEIWTVYADNVYTGIGNNLDAPDTVFADLTLFKVAKTVTTYTDPEAGPNGTDLPVATYVGAFNGADTWADGWTTFAAN